MSKLSGLIPSSAKRWAKLRLHQGATYTCPFCGYSARDLRTDGHDFAVLSQRQVIGGGRRPSRCYRCGSTDRERLVYLYLRDKARLLAAPGGRSVLHIAPEKRLGATLLGAGLKSYVAGDLFAEGYRYADHVQNIDVMDIPFPDDTFDVVICNHVLEHIPTDDVAMKELCRVLKPGGFAILQVPISMVSATTFEDDAVVDPRQREQLFGQFDHVRIYGRDYFDRLSASGFSVDRVNVAQEYASYGVNPDEEIFVCSK
jgi:SAM-dependent methyltransferase